MERIPHEESLNACLLIDPSVLQTETLEQLAREFVLREQGNDSSSLDLNHLVERALHNIRRRELLITFDPGTESVGVAHRLDPALKHLVTN